MAKEQRYLDLACRVALRSTFRRRHGAVVVRGGSVISFGINGPGFCQLSLRRRRDRDVTKATLHAEVDAVLGLDRSQTAGATMYCAQIGRDGHPKYSKPCRMCQAVLVAMGIRRVVFTVPGGYAVIVL